MIISYTANIRRYTATLVTSVSYSLHSALFFFPSLWSHLILRGIRATKLLNTLLFVLFPSSSRFHHLFSLSLSVSCLCFLTEDQSFLLDCRTSGIFFYEDLKISFWRFSDFLEKIQGIVEI